MKSLLYIYILLLHSACQPARPSIPIDSADAQNAERQKTDSSEQETLNSKKQASDQNKVESEMAVADSGSADPKATNSDSTIAIPDSQPGKPPIGTVKLVEPAVFLTKNSPNFRTRNAVINRIILHNTQGSYNSAIATLMEPNGNSAHIVVNLDGSVTRLVPDSLSAQHAKSDNAYSLGMEIVNRSQSLGGGLTEAQKPVVLKWVNYWRAKFGISVTNITMHRMAPGNINETDCAMYIWGSNAIFLKWRDANF